MFKAVNIQTKETVTGPWEVLADLDKRIWDLIEVPDTPKSHADNICLIALELSPENIVQRIKQIDSRLPHHGFSHYAIVESHYDNGNHEIRNYDGRYMKESY